MPHFEVKLYPGYRPEQLRTLTDHIVQAAVQDLKVPENVVSVAFQEIAPEHWQEQVYQPLVQDRDGLAKAPKYK